MIYKCEFVNMLQEKNVKSYKMCEMNISLEPVCEDLWRDRVWRLCGAHEEECKEVVKKNMGYKMRSVLIINELEL